MRVVVLVTHEDALAGPPHAMVLIVLLQALQPSLHRWILLRLCLFRAECVVGQRI